MIFFDTKTYAKVWKITKSDNGKYIDLQITTSEKDDDGNYINSSWFPRCIGHSVNSLKNLKVGDRIIITKCKMTNVRKKLDDESYRAYFNLLIFEAEIEGAKNSDAEDKATEESLSKKIDKKFHATPIEDEEDEGSPW